MKLSVVVLVFVFAAVAVICAGCVAVQSDFVGSWAEILDEETGIGLILDKDNTGLFFIKLDGDVAAHNVTWNEDVMDEDIKYAFIDDGYYESDLMTLVLEDKDTALFFYDRNELYDWNYTLMKRFAGPELFAFIE